MSFSSSLLIFICGEEEVPGLAGRAGGVAMVIHELRVLLPNMIEPPTDS